MSENNNYQLVDITDSMRDAYLEYAMSVIIGRALPDVRDGLKPVHRRILFSMHEINLAYNRPYAKSARVVGDVIGKYHPHGDNAIYDSLVRLVQDFSMRYSLIDGQGNFGSVDGDSAAAMRYTEVRLKKLTSIMLADIEKNTVDFQPNYDNSQREPVILPARMPSLLMNGSSGIAVGMATNIPPHNLGELIDGLIYLIDNRKDFSITKLMQLIPAPDFPTGGIIYDRQGIVNAYTKGNGIIKIRAKTSFEEVGKHQAIIIHELPYGVNKAKLVERIAELTSEKKLEEVSDIRDESDRHGMRVVIELKKGSISDAVLHKLFNLTSMQTSFGINMLAVVNKQPQVMNLPTMLNHFIDHRLEVVTRRTRFELRKTQDRAHIVEGLIKALANIDKIVELIKKAADAAIAKAQLQSQFEFSEVQAASILDMRLHRLTGLEQKKLVDELAELQKEILRLSNILENESVLVDLIKAELIEIKAEFADPRRTEITDDLGDIDPELTMKPELFAVSLSTGGYIKRTVLAEYRVQNRGGRGKIGMTTKDEDAVDQLMIASTHDDIMLFSDSGKVFWLKTYQLPESSRATKGRSLMNFIGLQENEKIVSMLNLPKNAENIYKDSFVIMATKFGVIKKTPFTEYGSKRANGTKSISLDDNDLVVMVRISYDSEQVFLATKQGMAALYNAKSLRAQGRVTRGSRGIKLKKENDEVVSLELVNENDNILTISKNGYGKRSKVSDYRLGSRGNIGVINMRLTDKTGVVISSMNVKDDDQVLIISENGVTIRLDVAQISQIGRNTQGVRLINLHDNDRVSAISLIDNDDLSKLLEQQKSGRLVNDDPESI